jgi:hypothetical protein
MMTRAARVAIGALIGAIPGTLLVLLTLPVSGEAELTLGVGGFLVGSVGLLAGAAVAARKHQ